MSQHTITLAQEAAPAGLVDAKSLIPLIWTTPDARPSLRWVREMQSRRAIPFIKCGRRVFFEPARVLAALRKFEVTCH